MLRELPVLYGFFQNLLMYEYMPDKSERTVAAQLGINPFFVKDYVAAAKRYPAGKTFRIIGYFREIDARAKGISNPSAKDNIQFIASSELIMPSFHFPTFPRLCLALRLCQIRIVSTFMPSRFW